MQFTILQELLYLMIIEYCVKIVGPKLIHFGGTNPILIRYGVTVDSGVNQIILCLDF